MVIACPWIKCGKTFGSKWALRRHYCYHTGVMPWVCDHISCHKSFADSYLLKRHKLSHSKVQHFSCSRRGCAKAFKSHTTLRHHLTLHDHSLAFSCSALSCLQCFANPSSLRVHTLLKHGIETSARKLSFLHDVRAFHSPVNSERVLNIKTTKTTVIDSRNAAGACSSQRARRHTCLMPSYKADTAQNTERSEGAPKAGSMVSVSYILHGEVNGLVFVHAGEQKQNSCVHNISACLCAGSSTYY